MLFDWRILVFNSDVKTDPEPFVHLTKVRNRVRGENCVTYFVFTLPELRL